MRDQSQSKKSRLLAQESQIKFREKHLKLLGQRITAKRRERSLSLEALAYGVGISKGNLSDIESFKRDPRYTTLVAIADGLELTLSELLDEL